MQLITEMMEDSDISELKNEMDMVLEKYRNLIKYTQLNEGVLDDLSDDLIQKVSEIQRRIEVITKARNIVSKLEKSGGFSKEEVSRHRKRLSNNRKSLSAALSRTMKNMEQFEKEAKKVISAKSVPDELSKNDGNSEAVDLEPFGRQAPFLLSQSVKGTLPNLMDDEKFDKYDETFDLLVHSGLLSKDGSITKKGKDSLRASRAGRNAGVSLKPKRSSADDTFDDLESMGDNGERELNF